jgi:hypothetical protein
MRKVFDQDAVKHVATAPAPDVDVFAPFIDWLAVGCPRCAAKPGESCVALSSASRDEKQYPHPLRVDAAREAAAT